MNGENDPPASRPQRIEPEPVQFINIPLNLRICEQNGPTSQIVDLSAWVESMKQALHAGAIFSLDFPICDSENCNAIGQRYCGRVRYGCR